MSRNIKIGVIGMGNVGGGVVELLVKGPSSLLERKRLSLELVKVAVKSLSKKRDIQVPEDLLTEDVSQVVNDPTIDIVAELIGGIEPARSFILKAIRNGKNVVTANKALLADCGDELFEAALKNGVDLLFEASVGGGIPIIRSLKNGLVANNVSSMYGILNGTTNYILTKMTDEGGDFEDVLAEAQKLGYAESDPTMDVDGTDAAQKLAVLSRIAFGSALKTRDVFKEGIQKIKIQDIEYARELGYAVKLLAIAKGSKDTIEVRVHPAMVPSGSIMAQIKGVFNAVEVVGDAVGTQVFYGSGAGRMPTASAVISDIVELSQRLIDRADPKVREMTVCDGPSVIPIDEVEIPYYFRFLVVDRPGVLAQIAAVFSDEKISIASVIQKGRAESQGNVPLVIMTHEAKEKFVCRAVERLNTLDIIKDQIQIIRVEDL